MKPYGPCDMKHPLAMDQPGIQYIHMDPQLSPVSTTRVDGPS